MTSVASWPLPPVRPGYPSTPDLRERRLAAARHGQVPVPGIEITEERFGTVDSIICAASRSTLTVVWLHGGGFRLGSARGWVPFASRLAAAAGVRVVVPNYRLAPEHPFPAALHDVLSVYAAVAAEGREPVVVGGDSAGAGLALSLSLCCAPAALSNPAGLVLLSPWVDLSVSAATFDSKATTDRLFSRQAARDAADAYLQGWPVSDSLVSPLRGRLSGLPPVQLFAGGDEVLLGDAVALIDRLALAQVSLEAHIVAGQQHVWPVVFPDLPASATALSATSRFLAGLA